MTTPPPRQTPACLEATFGLGRSWAWQEGSSATVLETPTIHLLWFDAAASDVELRRLWEARMGRQAYPVVLLAPAEDASTVPVARPQDARPVRELPAGRALDLLEASRSLAAREAASFLATESSRLQEAMVPGVPLASGVEGWSRQRIIRQKQTEPSPELTTTAASGVGRWATC